MAQNQDTQTSTGIIAQEGLRQARNYDDPKVADLQNKRFKTKDYEALNDDLKNAMKDFVRLKNQVESRRLKMRGKEQRNCRFKV